TLQMPTDLTWMIERYPVDSLVADPRTKGSKGAKGAMATSTAVMPVLSEQWLERLLLRLGPGTVVVSPERWRGLAGRAAADVLAAYGSVSLDS
ncbi:MAG: hypothetical protein JWN62_3068, partial [Acidimicrobiales bacterium]|nr:hypothetical protein [Acidimicrobiales bacterium]